MVNWRRFQFLIIFFSLNLNITGQLPLSLSLPLAEMTPPPFETSPLVLRLSLGNWAELVFWFGSILLEIEVLLSFSVQTFRPVFRGRLWFPRKQSRLLLAGSAWLRFGWLCFLGILGSFFGSIFDRSGSSWSWGSWLLGSFFEVGRSEETLVRIGWLWTLEVELRVWGRFGVKENLRFS